MSDFRSASPPSAPPACVLFSANEVRPGTMHMLWIDAGAGVRFAADAPLQVLPPGEPVELRVLVQNLGPYVLPVHLAVDVATEEGEEEGRQGSTGDLPAGSVLDATYSLALESLAAGCHLSVYCQPLRTTGRMQDPWRPPALFAGNGTPASTMAPAQASVAFRAHPRCPRCNGPMRWVPRQGSRPRAWTCEDCAHRVETGILG